MVILRCWECGSRAPLTAPRAETGLLAVLAVPLRALLSTSRAALPLGILRLDLANAVVFVEGGPSDAAAIQLDLSHAHRGS